MDKEIKINDFIQPLKKRYKLIILITLLTTALSGLYSMKTTTLLYQSSTRIFFSFIPTDYVSTMGIILKDPTVLNKVADMLEPKRSAKSLGGQLSLSGENNSQFIKITAVDADPTAAAQIANASAQVFMKEIGNILSIYDAKVLSEATPNFSPINANPRYHMDIGFAAGIVISIGLVLFLDSLDHSIGSEQEVRRQLGLPVLGTVSKITKKSLRQQGGKRKSAKERGEVMDA